MHILFGTSKESFNLNTEGFSFRCKCTVNIYILRGYTVTKYCIIVSNVAAESYPSYISPGPDPRCLLYNKLTVFPDPTFENIFLYYNCNFLSRCEVFLSADPDIN